MRSSLEVITRPFLIRIDMVHPPPGRLRFVHSSPAVDRDRTAGVAHLPDEVEIEIGDDHLIPVTAAFRHDLSTRIAEVALPVELADVHGLPSQHD